MKAAYIQTTGPASVIQFGEVADPQPGPTEVLIQTAAVAVNPIDTYIRSGLVALNLPDNYIIGCDVAGTVQAVGE